MWMLTALSRLWIIFAEHNLRYINILGMFNQVKKIWESLGPGIVTGASDDDPSGIATYSQAGARFGMQTLWMSWVTLPLMIVILQMCARLSIATSRGLAQNIKLHYPKWILYFVIFITLPAIVFNISANLMAMDAVARLLFPQVPRGVFSLAFTALLIPTIVFFSYNRIAAILKWLCLVLLVYFVVPFLVEQQWGNVLMATFIPTIEWSHEYLYMLVAIIGTTISPYLFFWQSAMSMEHQMHRKYQKHVDTQMQEMKVDINLGMIISNLVMFFIILTTASVLFPAGITSIHTLDQAAEAIKPLAGNYAYLLFALGVIGTGLLAIPVLAGSIAYFLSDTFDLDGGIDKPWRKAKSFYLVVVGAIVVGFVLSLANMMPVQALIYTAVAYGIICPVMIGLILHICNNKAVMGRHVNTPLANFLGGIALILTSGAALVLLYFM